MRALVLSGGSIKGAFQAGAIAELLERGYEPETIWGTSVGSLNGGFLADRVGAREPAAPDWPAAGRALERFWIEEVTSFRRLGRKRRLPELAWAIATGRFDGLLDMSPLVRLVRSTLSAERMARSRVGFHACAVDIASGEAVYADKADPRILDYIVASTAIPLVMPVAMVGATPLWDGGIREVAPLRKAIVDAKATEIVCVACDPTRPGGAAIRGGKAPLLELAGRLMDIVVSEMLANDIEAARNVNRYLEENPAPRGRLAERRRIPIAEIRPATPLVIELESFTADDIAAVVRLGRERAAAAWPVRGVP